MQKYPLVIGDFELYINFSNLVQQVFLHYNLFKYFFKVSTKIRGCQQGYIIQIYAKIHWCSLKKLSKSSYFALWSSWLFSIATLFYFNLVPMIFLLLREHPTKPLSPGDWTHWRILSACNKAFFFLSKTASLQNLHQQDSGFAQMILPSSPTSRETLVWSFWPLQEFPRYTQHYVEHLVFMDSFGMFSSLHYDLVPLTQQPCPLSSQLSLSLSC